MTPALRDEIEAARASRRRHRRLRFNLSPVAEFLGLGVMPPEILDVAGLCERLGIERDALEQLIAAGLPCADISARAVRERQGNGDGR
jgi:hypothetical protein